MDGREGGVHHRSLVGVVGGEAVMVCLSAYYPLRGGGCLLLLLSLPDTIIIITHHHSSSVPSSLQVPCKEGE